MSHAQHHSDDAFPTLRQRPCAIKPGEQVDGKASAKGMERKMIFLVAMAMLPVCGVLFTLTDSPYAVVGVQLPDGVAAGIFGVLSLLIASDLMRASS